VSGDRNRTQALLLVGVAVFAVAVGVLFYATGVMHETELGTIDSRFSIRGDEEPRDDIVLVLIDVSALRNSIPASHIRARFTDA
jgi:CHASE2 domain-containing sensor protein